VEIHESVSELIGNTPLVRLRSVAAGRPATVVAKVEYLNPGGSVKDRIARKMIDEAERSGALKPGGIIGDWPGLGAAALFEGRDLRPTVDSRSLFKGLLLDHLGIERKLLDRQVFPDSTSAAPLTGLV
jgi:hypothetical protein